MGMPEQGDNDAISDDDSTRSAANDGELCMALQATLEVFARRACNVLGSEPHETEFEVEDEPTELQCTSDRLVADQLFDGQVVVAVQAQVNLTTPHQWLSVSWQCCCAWHAVQSRLSLPPDMYS